MNWKILNIGEGTDINDNGKFYRFKRVRFDVNGSEHTLRISMSDFDAGKTHDIVEKEANKILQAYSGK